MRPAPYMPYLTYAPSADTAQVPRRWIQRRRQDDVRQRGECSGRRQFIVGAQNQDSLWAGNLTKFAPNGKPLSPHPTGLTGGGVEGIGFGFAIDSPTTLGPT